MERSREAERARGPGNLRKAGSALQNEPIARQRGGATIDWHGGHGGGWPRVMATPVQRNLRPPLGDGRGHGLRGPDRACADGRCDDLACHVRSLRGRPLPPGHPVRTPLRRPVQCGRSWLDPAEHQPDGECPGRRSRCPVRGRHRVRPRDAGTCRRADTAARPEPAPDCRRQDPRRPRGPAAQHRSSSGPASLHARRPGRKRPGRGPLDAVWLIARDLLLLALNEHDEASDVVANEDSAFVMVRTHLERHFTDADLTIDQMTRRLKVSRRYVEGLFARQGLSPAAYLRSLRLARAR